MRTGSALLMFYFISFSYGILAYFVSHSDIEACRVAYKEIVVTKC